MVPTLPLLFEQLGISFGLGLLVGLQRQHSAHIAGIRTFPLVTLLGTVCAFLARELGQWVMVGGFLGVLGTIVVGNLPAKNQESQQGGPGMTTEAAMLVMYAVGAWATFGPRLVVLAVGGGVAVLLQAKEPLHRLSSRLGEDDLRAIMQFVLLSCIILPIVPNRTFGPFAVLNPREIWLMVVLIVGLSLSAYLVYKFFGQNAGTILGGVLGGLISSTATTASYARRAKQSPEGSLQGAVVIAIASTVLWARLLAITTVVAPRFGAVRLPMIILGGSALVGAAVLWLRGRRQQNEMPVQGNPTELKGAFVFAALFAVIIFATAAAQQYLGSRGLYAIAGISGLTDVDAITLSTARLVEAEKLEAGTGWRVIVVAVLSNSVFKTLMAGALGGRRLFAYVAAVMAVTIATGVVLMLLL